MSVHILHRLTGHPAIQTTSCRLSYLRVFVLCLLLLALAMAVPARSETADQKNMDTEALVSEAVDLISRLHRLEEQLLFPAHTRVSVFLSVAENSSIDPHSVSLEIDNSKIAEHIYTQREASALKSGGIQRLYTGNILMGKHKLQVSFRQARKDGSVRQHELEYKFSKDERAENIEIIIDSVSPHITIKDRN